MGLDAISEVRDLSIEEQARLHILEGILNI